ncbi:MAG TPA: cytochrome c [Gemmatimonadales bacterium]
MNVVVHRVAAAAVALFAGAPAAAQSVSEGSYTIDQADRGEAVFRDICSSCHTPGQFSGSVFLRAWNGTTAYDLFTLMRTTMPYDNPGQLRREQYADVMAYVFKLNGLPTGPRELPSDDAGLRRVKIEPPSPE